MSASYIVEKILKTEYRIGCFLNIRITMIKILKITRRKKCCSPLLKHSMLCSHMPQHTLKIEYKDSAIKKREEGRKERKTRTQFFRFSCPLCRGYLKDFATGGLSVQMFEVECKTAV